MSQCSACPRLGKAPGGCRERDAVAGGGGDGLWAGGPGLKSECLYRVYD